MCLFLHFLPFKLVSQSPQSWRERSGVADGWNLVLRPSLQPGWSHLGWGAGALVTGQLLPTRLPQTLQQEPGEKSWMVLGNKRTFVHYEQGASGKIWCKGGTREGQQPPHLCSLLGRRANVLNRSVGFGSQEAIDSKSSKVPYRSFKPNHSFYSWGH